MTLQDRFRRDGYVKLEGLVDATALVALMTVWREDLLPSPEPMMRAHGQAEAHQLTDHGYIRNSLLNAHHYRSCPVPRLNAALRNILSAPGFTARLEEATSLTPSAFVQTLLFDLGPEIWPHQDTVYLDSYPAGSLVAVWIALEDIHPDAGPLYFLPRHLTPPLPSFAKNQIFNSTDYQTFLMDLIKKDFDKLDTPDLKKGDAMLWVGDVIHGSHAVQNPMLSRKSLAAHWVPSGYGMQSHDSGMVFKAPWRPHMIAVDG